MHTWTTVSQTWINESRKYIWMNVSHVTASISIQKHKSVLQSHVYVCIRPCYRYEMYDKVNESSRHTLVPSWHRYERMCHVMHMRQHVWWTMRQIIENFSCHKYMNVSCHKYMDDWWSYVYTFPMCHTNTSRWMNVSHRKFGLSITKLTYVYTYIHT